MRKVQFKATSEHGVTPDGNLSPENLLKWLDANIIACNGLIESAGMNGSSNSYAEGQRQALKEMKTQLFGTSYDT